MFHVLYDGTVVDEHNYSVLGGDSEVIAERVSQTWSENLSLRDAVRVAVGALAGPDRTLDRDRSRGRAPRAQQRPSRLPPAR